MLAGHVRRYPGPPPTLVALHGFTQTGAVFSELAAAWGGEVLAPDLPGHGRASDRPATMPEAVAVTLEALAAAADPILLGYSLGGRVALHTVLSRPGSVDRLVLVSTSPGIADADARRHRLGRDEQLALQLEREGLEAFLAEWTTQPMFAGLHRRGRRWRQRDLEMRRDNTATGLAAALRGMGQGQQDYLGGQLADLDLEALIVVGAEDQPYRRIGTALTRVIPSSRLAVVGGCGHGVVGERPAELAAVVRAWLEHPPPHRPSTTR